MAAWRRSGQIEKHKEKLVSRMLAKGIAEDFAHRVFDQIRGFGEYGFPESHAASFALIAWSTAWMKHHYPEVFACALLNAWPMGFYAPSTIVEDAKRHGVEVRPVDVQASEWECTLEARANAEAAAERPAARAGNPGAGTNKRHGGTSPGAGPSADGPNTDGPSASPTRPFAIRMGLRYVKGLSRGDYGRIRHAREVPAETPVAGSDRGAGEAPAPGGGGPRAGGAGAEGLRAFVQQSRLDADVLEILARAGALECYGVGRRTALWRVLGKRGASGAPRTWAPTAGAFEAAATGPGGKPEAQLYVADLDAFEDAQPEPVFPQLEAAESVAWDYSTIRHSAAGHPLEAYREQLARLDLPDAQRLSTLGNGRRVSYAGLVICRQRPATASGTVFMTMEDETGFVNLIIWKSAFEKFRSLIITSAFLGVSGKFQNEEGVSHIIVDSVWKPRVDAPRAAPNSRDFH
jgi:error-prone DNA polymerase